MATIIAGHFRSREALLAARDELARQDFQPREYAAYARAPGSSLFALGEIGGRLFGEGEGPLLAVCVDRPGTEAAAILILSRCGAWEIERAEGDWRDGGWRDYDPRAPREILKTS